MQVSIEYFDWTHLTQNQSWNLTKENQSLQESDHLKTMHVFKLIFFLLVLCVPVCVSKFIKSIQSRALPTTKWTKIHSTCCVICVVLALRNIIIHFFFAINSFGFVRKFIVFPHKFIHCECVLFAAIFNKSIFYYL